MGPITDTEQGRISGADVELMLGLLPSGVTNTSFLKFMLLIYTSTDYLYHLAVRRSQIVQKKAQAAFMLVCAIKHQSSNTDTTEEFREVRSLKQLHRRL